MVPGEYAITLTVGEQQLSATGTVVADPLSTASQEDLQEQHDLLLKIHQKIGATIGAINRMRDLRQQLDGWAKRTRERENGAPIAEAAQALRGKVLEIEKQLLIPDLRAGWADNLNQGVRLLEQIASLPGAVALGDYKPTDQAYEVFEYMSAKIDAQVNAFEQLVAAELPPINAQIAGAQLGPIAV